jgi:hypothetical protein
VVGVIGAVVGTANLAGNYWFEAFVSPWLADVVPQFLDAEPAGYLTVGGASSYSLFTIGWVLFAVASLRAGVYPRAISIALLVAAVIGIQFVQPPLGVPFALVIAGLGGWLIRHPAHPA